MPAVDLGKLATPVGLGLSALQLIGGTVQTAISSQKVKSLTAQRKAFQTPEEALKILQATEALAGQGFDSFTLNYLTNQTNKATANALDVAKRIGADPNQLSAILDQNINAIMKIGSENHVENMKNFGNFLNAMDMVAKNKEAEWVSKENILKDKIQAAVGSQREGVQNMFNSANSIVGILSASGVGNMFGNTAKSDANAAAAQQKAGS